MSDTTRLIPSPSDPSAAVPESPGHFPALLHPAALADAERLVEQLADGHQDLRHRPTGPEAVPAVEIWGIPLARLSYEQTLDVVDDLIARGDPAFFITANLHYAMLTARDRRLAEANDRAAFLVADGMPMVWHSRLVRRPLPERVAGADLIYVLCRRAAAQGHTVFLLGGGPGVAEEAAERLVARYPALKIVGLEAPELDEMSCQEHQELVDRIRKAGPDLLLVAFGQPKGELWLAANYRKLGVPACVQLGASFDFVAGRVRRAPQWVQRTGAEWLYRIAREPGRMIPRYAADAAFLFRTVARDVLAQLRRWL